jgi:microcin C transport system substrate-binding protein
MNKALILLFGLFLLNGCTGSGESAMEIIAPSEEVKTEEKEPEFKVSYEVTEKLPAGLKFITNESEPTFASEKAKPGGMLRVYVPSFPATLRTVGPDSNGTFRGYILDNLWSAVTTHPNSRKTLPLLASEWGFGADGKSFFFRIHPDARWSDGPKVTADDFLFMWEMMRSKNIYAPYYNDYFKKEIVKIVKYDDRTIGVFAPIPKPDLEQYLAISPRPKHFYGGQIPEDYVQKYNWIPEPTVGPYYVKDFRKGKYLLLEKTPNWWAKELKYMKGRFNVDQIKIKVIRDKNVAFEYFKKGDLDVYELMASEDWFRRGSGEVFDRGIVEKTMAYTDPPQSMRGFYLNRRTKLFDDRNVRLAFAHAMNIEKGIERVFRNDVLRLARPYTGYGEYSNLDIEPRMFDIKRVESLMKQSGWQRGSDGIWTKGARRFSVKVTTGYAIYADFLAFLKEEAKSAGVEMELEILDSVTSFKKVLEKKHEVSFSAWSTTLTPSFWQAWHSDNGKKEQTNNISATMDPELDLLIEKYRDTSDKKERVALSHQVIAKIHDIADFVPSHYFPYVRAAHWKWMRLPQVPGTALSDQYLFEATSDVNGGLFWIDTELKEEIVNMKRWGGKLKPVTRIDKTFLKEK